MIMPYGLTDIEMQKIIGVFAGNPRIDSAVLYGSRAKGCFKPFSDVDITLTGDSLSRSDLSHVLIEIDDLLLPYQFDISLWHTLKNEELKGHIVRRGIEIYKKSEAK